MGATALSGGVGAAALWDGVGAAARLLRFVPCFPPAKPPRDRQLPVQVLRRNVCHKYSAFSKFWLKMLIKKNL